MLYRSLSLLIRNRHVITWRASTVKTKASDMPITQNSCNTGLQMHLSSTCERMTYVFVLILKKTKTKKTAYGTEIWYLIFSCNLHCIVSIFTLFTFFPLSVYSRGLRCHSFIFPDTLYVIWNTTLYSQMSYLLKDPCFRCHTYPKG